jgi:hypothetical protein
MPDNILAFRRRYPEGRNIVVCHDVDKAYTRKDGNIEFVFDSVEGLLKSCLREA